MNKRTSETLELLTEFKLAYTNGKITKEEYREGILLLYDKMSVLDSDNVKVNELLQYIKTKININKLNIIDVINYTLCPN